MSRTREIKDNVLRAEEKTDKQKVAKLAGIARGCGSIGLRTEGVTLSFETQNEGLVKKTVKLLKSLYQCDANVSIEETNLHSSLKTVEVPHRDAVCILNDIGVLGADGNVNYGFSDWTILNEPTEAAAFVCGVFLACGNVFLPEHKGGSYRLEFVFSNETAADDFAFVLSKLNLIPKKVARKSSFVIYLQESESVCDFFAMIGAGSVVLEIQNLKAGREMRNLINRQNNCITANMDKSATASAKQLAAIELIEKTAGLDSLPDKLKELALLRLENREATLDDLRTQLGGEISKSAINHRFRKILNLAWELGGKGNDF